MYIFILHNVFVFCRNSLKVKLEVVHGLYEQTCVVSKKIVSQYQGQYFLKGEMIFESHIFRDQLNFFIFSVPAIRAAVP